MNSRMFISLVAFAGTLAFLVELVNVSYSHEPANWLRIGFIISIGFLVAAALSGENKKEK